MWPFLPRDNPNAIEHIPLEYVRIIIIVLIAIAIIINNNNNTSNDRNNILNLPT